MNASGRRPRPSVTELNVIITYNSVMASVNPFIYGEVVTATAFADREHEREQSIAMRAPRSAQRTFMRAHWSSSMSAG